MSWKNHVNISVITLITLLCNCFFIFLSPMSVCILRASILSYWACFLGIQPSVCGMAGGRKWQFCLISAVSWHYCLGSWAKPTGSSLGAQWGRRILDRGLLEAMSTNWGHNLPTCEKSENLQPTAVKFIWYPLRGLCERGGVRSKPVKPAIRRPKSCSKSHV